MRVYVIEPLGKGGLIHYSYQLCRGLQRTGLDVTLITATQYELDNYPHEFRLVKFLNLWDPRSHKSKNPILRIMQRVQRGIVYVWEWLRLVRYLKREKPDVILFGEIRFGFESYFLRMLRPIPLADIVHDVRSYNMDRRTSGILKEDKDSLEQYNRIYQLFSALMVHDKSNYDLFLSLYDVPAEKVHQIVHATSELMLEVEQKYTPQELKKHLQIPDGKPILLFFGTLTRYKGIEDLIDAFPLVLKRQLAHLVIAGFPAKDIMLETLQSEVEHQNVSEHVTWHPDYVPNEWVASLMQLSDLVILPYRAISQSGILQVAYACGKPVIATRVGGLPDVVLDGKTGFLAEPENPESLADAIVAALQNTEQLEALGQNALHLAENQYSWLSVAQQIKTIFEGITKTS